MDARGLVDRWTISTSPNGLRVASIISLRGAVDLWDTESGQQQQTLEHDEEPRCLAFSSCGQWMGGGLTRSVWLWNFASDKTAEGGERRGGWKCLVRIRDIFERVNSIAWKPDTLEFRIGCANGSLQLWRLVETSSSSLSDAWSAQLVWSIGNPVLAASDTIFANSSLANQELLTLRGNGPLHNVSI